MKLDNKSKEIVITRINEFDKKFKDQFKSERDKKKGKEGKAMNQFNRLEIITKDDGSILLVGELYLHVIYKDKDGNVIGEKKIFGDMVAIKKESYFGPIEFLKNRYGDTIAAYHH